MLNCIEAPINHVDMEGRKGEGRFSQMPILLHKTYEVKWSTKWSGSEMKKN